MEKIWRAAAWTLAILIGAALLARAVFVDVWTVPDDDPKLAASLAPTLLPGDTVLMLTRGTPPGFGDLVRCTDPDDPKRFITARIAGLSGDDIELDNSTLRLNRRSYSGEMSCPWGAYKVSNPKSGEDVELSCDLVRMGGGWHYRLYSSKPAPFATPITAHVGDDMLYLLSDDRFFHEDSRDFGPVPRGSCKGPIFFRLWGKDGLRDEQHRFVAIH